MKEIKKYYVDKLTNGKITLVKVLNEYNSKEEAKEDLFKLVTGNKKEREILKDYSKKDIFK